MVAEEIFKAEWIVSTINIYRLSYNLSHYLSLIINTIDNNLQMISYPQLILPIQHLSLAYTFVLKTFYWEQLSTQYLLLWLTQPALVLLCSHFTFSSLVKSS